MNADLVLTLIVLVIGVAAALDVGGFARRLSRANGDELPAHGSRGDRFVASLLGTRIIGLLITVGALVWLIWPDLRR